MTMWRLEKETPINDLDKTMDMDSLRKRHEKVL